MAEVITLPDSIPPLAEGHDRAVIVLDLRRADPPNEDGSPRPDVVPGIVGDDPEATLALLDAAAALGYDEALSYVTVAELTEVEAGGAVSIADLRNHLASTPGEGGEGGEGEPPTEG